MTICPECEENNRDISIFCVNCGEELIPQDTASPPIIAPPSAALFQKAEEAASPLTVEPRTLKKPGVPFPEIPEDIATDAAAPVQDAPARVEAPFPDDLEDEVKSALGPQDGISPRGAAAFPGPPEEKEQSVTASVQGASSRIAAPFPDDPGYSEESTPVSHMGANPAQVSSSDRNVFITTIPAPVEWHGNECKMCGFQNEPEAVYCDQCGTALSKQREFTEESILTTLKLVQLTFDGVELVEFNIDAHGLSINSLSGDISPMYEYHTDSHAMFQTTDKEIVMIPPRGKNGIFARIPSKKNVEIQSGSIFRIGHQMLLFEATAAHPDCWGTLRVTAQNPQQEVIPLHDEEIIIGRVNGNIRFLDDLLVSSTHVKIFIENGKFFLHDVGSTNGTFLRVDTKYHPIPGQVFIIGPKIYKISASGQSAE